MRQGFVLPEVTKRRERSYDVSFRHAMEARGLKVIRLKPSKIGYPDRILLGPKRRMCFVELKREGKEPDAAQVAVHRELAGLGFATFVVAGKRVPRELTDHMGVAPCR